MNTSIKCKTKANNQILFVSMCRITSQNAAKKKKLKAYSAANLQSIYSPPCGKTLLSLQTWGLVLIQLANLSLSPESFLWFLSWRLTSTPGIKPTYLPTLLSLPSAQKNSRSVFTAQVSCSPSCLPSHTTTSSISSAQCYWSKNHPVHRLPVCYSYDLEQFILDLRTRTHVSNSYKR